MKKSLLIIFILCTVFIGGCRMNTTCNIKFNENGTETIIKNTMDDPYGTLAEKMSSSLEDKGFTLDSENMVGTQPVLIVSRMDKNRVFFWPEALGDTDSFNFLFDEKNYFVFKTYNLHVYYTINSKALEFEDGSYTGLNLNWKWTYNIKLPGIITNSNSDEKKNGWLVWKLNLNTTKNVEINASSVLINCWVIFIMVLIVITGFLFFKYDKYKKMQYGSSNVKET